MFRSLTVKAFFSKKPMKRIIVTFSLVIAIWLLLIAFFIYIENHKAYVISIDDLSVSFPTKYILRNQTVLKQPSGSKNTKAATMSSGSGFRKLFN